ncbi:zinc finger protein 462-like isoform X2 [Syngnathoides biaculeatus]|uniref:zinc finger protein 462-like isoform X2 n=1 Tax=Syngnathoides biaculeatus TaxID=300417 RepID=UPI002ADDE3F8|nr:zinc finger protein 462-like isoform X2 [Syngnathoides biaculeatus]
MTSCNGMQKEDTDENTMHNESTPQDLPRQSFQCSRCPLNFKSKVFLFKHLTHDHGSDLDLNNYAKKASPKRSPESPVAGLQTSPSEVLNHHDDGKILNDDVTQMPEIELLAVSASHRDQGEREEEDHLYHADLMRPIFPPSGLESKRTSNVDKTTLDLTDKKELSFEVSEDDEDKRVSPSTYSCKHCSHKDGSLKHMSVHYHTTHPYIQCNSDYIQDWNDRSATFRCLMCPVDFLSEDDLRKHCSDEHAGSPDIFTLDLHQMNFVFKCFTCVFTTNSLEVLKVHYKETHPMDKTLNTLMFLKYISTQRQEDLSPVKTHSLETTEPNEALYQCNSCPFRHKSIIVLQVHYQKIHPEEAVTIDKIKQRTGVAQKKRLKCPSSEGQTKSKDKVETLQAKSESSLPERARESSEAQTKTKHKVKILEEKAESFTPKKAQERPEAQSKTKDKVKIPKSKAESSTPGKLEESLEAQMKTRDKVEIVDSELSSPERVRKSSKVQMKTEDKVKILEAKSKDLITARVNSPEDQNEVVDSTPEETHKAEVSIQNQVVGTSSLNSFAAKCKEMKVKRKLTSNIYASPENLYFCYKCNYGNPTIKGVMVHQFRTHNKLRTTSEHIVAYTTKIHNRLQKSVPHTEDPSFSPLLPLPILNEGDEHTFFCHFCHYRRSTVSKVVQHYVRRHNGMVATPKEIQAYTFRTLALLQKTDVYEEARHKKTPNKQQVRQKFKSLHCKGCAYKTHNASLLRVHIRKCHRGNHSSSGVLKVYLKQGNVQSGYQCDLCSFSHQKSTALYKHYRQVHPESRSSLDFITTRLKEGPKSAPVKKKIQIKHLSNRDESNISKQDDVGGFSCRSCSFKGSSAAEIMDHYRAVHPWCLEENGLMPGVGSRNKASSSKNEDDHQEVLSCFDDYQIPLDSPSTSPEHIKPPQSPTREDRNSASRESEPSVDPDEATHVHVFKCPYCTYVNTKHQGVLTHCQMKHSALQSRADSLYVDEVHLRNWERKKKGQEGDALHFRGYMCELCPQTHDTREKLRRHRVKDHCETSPDATGVTNATKMHVIPKSISYKIKMTLFRCQQCTYSCSNKIAFGRHMRLKHKSSAFQESRFSCVLCSNSYYKKKRLGGHYKDKHGQEAYQKHFLSLYEQVPDTPLEPKDKTVTRTKRLVYKCLRCPYFNSRMHGMATHCQMMHPDFKVRMNEFERKEINMSSNYQAGTNNKRGYQCNLCLGVYVSFKKLSVHCANRHNGASKQEKENFTSEDLRSRESLLEATPLIDANPDGMLHKKLEDEYFVYKCFLCSYSSVIRKRLGGHYTKRHGKSAFLKHFAPLYLRKVKKVQLNPEVAISEQPENLLEEGEELLYQCQMCEYKTWARRYLTYHYNNTHKLDVVTRDRLLKEYNKRRRPPPQDLPPDLEQSLEDPEQTVPTQCKKCPDLSFDSPQLLLTHYCAVHRTDRRVDFTVIHPAGRATGVYRCMHCHKTLNGIRKLGRHLDQHREKNLSEIKAKNKMASPLGKKTAKSSTLDTTSERLSGCNALQDEGSPLTISMVASPQKATDHGQTDAESLNECHACSQCQRSFKSRNGLRTHMRSHEALAAIKKLPASLSQLNLNAYLLHKPGTIRPFQCSICFYRTNLMGLWTNHLLKNHLDTIIETCDNKEETCVTHSADRDAPHLGHKVVSVAKTNEGRTKDWYLEPPEVQRQLSHLSLMTQNGASTMPATRQNGSSGLFCCENCSFISKDLPSMRRHYISRHGRKMLACKDCDFFTGLKKAMKTHMETDHSTFQKEAPLQDGLRCPFCLYQTKHKNNMIDHVLLHREERVVPMEVRRPRLSRYLQGLVFRCHVCTYTSASADNLRSHVAKHEHIKPYQCRLCYFDCTRLADLEAHLCAKHQVMRNHELVGQVNLEQLEEVKLKESPEDEVNDDNNNKEEEQRSKAENAEDLLSHLKETDTRKPTEEEGEVSNREGNLPAMALVKWEHQNSAGPSEKKDDDNSQVALGNHEEQEKEGMVVEEEQISNPENAKDFFSHVKETDTTGKLTQEGGNNCEHRLPEMDVVKREHQNGTSPSEKDCNNSQLAMSSQEKEMVVGVEDRSSMEQNRKHQLLKLQTLSLEVHEEEKNLRHNHEPDEENGMQSSLRGKELHADVLESSAKAAKKTLKGETSSHLLAFSLEQLREDNTHKRKLCEGLKEEGMKEEEGQDGEGQKKRIKVENKRIQQDSDMSELKDAAKIFPCSLCGRNLQSEAALQSHASRHGM